MSVSVSERKKSIFQYHHRVTLIIKSKWESESGVGGLSCSDGAFDIYAL